MSRQGPALEVVAAGSSIKREPRHQHTLKTQKGADKNTSHQGRGEGDRVLIFREEDVQEEQGVPIRTEWKSKLRAGDRP